MQCCEEIAEAELRLRAGHAGAVGELFTLIRPRLKRMLEFRMDTRLRRRVDASDVIQDVFLEASRRVDEYRHKFRQSPYVWVRLLASQRLAALHRFHLGAKLRSVGNEVSLHRGGSPQGTTMSLAADLMGQLTSPSRAAVRSEVRAALQQALNDMEPIDREIIALRHYEELTNNEVADILKIRKSAASNRYIRALKRLRGVLPEY